MQNQFKYFIIPFLFAFIATNSPVYAQNKFDRYKDFFSLKDYKSIIVNNHKKHYLIHVPKNYNPQSPTPMVIVFHGAGSNPKDIEDVTNFSKKSEDENFITVYPAGDGYFRLNRFFLTWDVPNDFIQTKKSQEDIEFVNQLIKSISAEYNIDKKRIFITGFSSGAAFCYEFAYYSPESISASSIVSGYFDYDKLSKTASTPFIIFHGVKDCNVLYSGGCPKRFFDKIQRGYDKGIKEVTTFWVNNDNCNPRPIHQEFPNLIVDKFVDNQKKEKIVLYSILDSKHAWAGGYKTLFGGEVPSKRIIATDVMWDFFEKQAKGN